MALTHEGRMYLNPSMIRHLARMVGCHLWRGEHSEVVRYAGILRSIVHQVPRAADLLTDVERKRLERVIDEITRGDVPEPWTRSTREISGTIAVPEGRLPESWNERDVAMAVALDLSLMAPFGDVSAIEYLQLEARAGDGRIDLSFVIGNTAHVVEFKTCRADHGVVGQIQKYMREVGGRVHYGIYEDVRGWVVAPGFTEDAMTHLSEAGVRMVRLSLPSSVPD